MADLFVTIQRTIERKDSPNVDFEYEALNLEEVFDGESITNHALFADLKSFVSENYTETEIIRVVAENENRVRYQKAYQTATYVSKANPEKALDTLDSLLAAGKLSIDDVLKRFSK